MATLTNSGAHGSRLAAEAARHDAGQGELAVVLQLGGQADELPVGDISEQRIEGELHVGMLTHREPLGQRGQPARVLTEVAGHDAARARRWPAAAPR